MSRNAPSARLLNQLRSDKYAELSPRFVTDDYSIRLDSETSTFPHWNLPAEQLPQSITRDFSLETVHLPLKQQQPQPQPHQHQKKKKKKKKILCWRWSSGRRRNPEDINLFWNSPNIQQKMGGRSVSQTDSQTYRHTMTSQQQQQQ